MTTQQLAQLFIQRSILLLGLLLSVNTVLHAEQLEAKTATNMTDVLLIDVRTEAEFQAGHLDNATLIPYDIIANQITTVAPDKNQAIELYCRSGRRSEIALQALQQLGYTNVTNIGGYDDLLNKGYQRAVD